MIKTIKEMQAKAMHLQGDYQVAYEDMVRIFWETRKELQKKPLNPSSFNTWEEWRGYVDALDDLKEALGLSDISPLDSE